MSFESNRKVWATLAETDPLWAILSDPEMRGNRWELDAFFRSGIETVSAEIDSILETYPDLRFNRALDFGCGVGRLTQALATRFDSVVGIDVAPRMIELAQSFNQAGERIEFRMNAKPELSLLESDSIDFALSLITLQHIDEASALAYLKEFLRVLRPGGAAYFQLTTLDRSKRNGAAAWAQRLGKFVSSQPRYVMNCVPRSVVESLIRENGGELLRARMNNAGGEKYESYDYLARKLYPNASSMNTCSME